MRSQDGIFAHYEGDNWFKRNFKSLVPKEDLVILLLEQYNVLSQRQKEF